jgi:two-component system CheB/CheR fusion protein
MHKLSTTVAMLEHELSELRLLLERKTGVLLDTETETLIAVAGEFLKSQHLGSVEELLVRVRSSDAECESLAGRLLDGATGFFRYPAAFESLAKLALPDLLQRRTSDHPRALRIWSAGCSTGEEPYSIAISVCEATNGNNGNGGCQVHVVATDIGQHALEAAKRGLYPESELQSIPRHILQTYFARVGEHFLVKPRLRNLVTFSTMNLAQPAYLGQFDCIFCMDVLPRFSAAQRVALTQRLHLYLQPGGYLFLGQREKLPAADVSFNSHKNKDYVIYQKPLAAGAKSGR